MHGRGTGWGMLAVAAIPGFMMPELLRKSDAT